MNPDATPVLPKVRTDPRLIRIHQRDNVAVALVDLPTLAHASVGGTDVQLRQAVPFGHKVALADIQKGSPVIKYGEQIGIATRDISAGQHVHVHNVASTRGRGDLAIEPDHGNV